MAFRNFVVSGGAKEASFIPRDPKEFNYGVGSPSVSVNNNDVDAMVVEPITAVEAFTPADTKETPLAIESVPDVEVLSSDDGPVTLARSSGIADRVRERKGTVMKAPKPPVKRKFDVQASLSRATKQKEFQYETIVTAASEDPDDDDIHGKTYRASSIIITFFYI